MERIRIGNDIAISWALFENNGATHLINAGGASVSLNCGGYTYLVPSFSVQGNVVSFIFPAEDQVKTGKYKIVLTERNESGLVSSYDVRDAFVLVPENEMLNVGYTQQKNVEITSVITHAAIANIKTISIVESEEEGGDNVVTFVLTDGSQFPMTVKNGSKGDKGDKGDQGIQGEKGDKGDTGARGPAGIEEAEVTVDATTGTPAVQTSVVDGKLNMAFSGLKGEKGDKGEQGNSGFQGDFTDLEIVNGLEETTVGKALDATQGNALDSKISQLGQEVLKTTQINFVSSEFAPYKAKSGDILRIKNTSASRVSISTRETTSGSNHDKQSIGSGLFVVVVLTYDCNYLRAWTTPSSFEVSYMGSVYNDLDKRVTFLEQISPSSYKGVIYGEREIVVSVPSYNEAVDIFVKQETVDAYNLTYRKDGTLIDKVQNGINTQYFHKTLEPASEFNELRIYEGSANPNVYSVIVIPHKDFSVNYADYNKLNDSVEDIYSIVHNSISNKLSTRIFAHGGLNDDGTTTNVQFRVVTPVAISFNRDLHIKASNGFRFGFVKIGTETLSSSWQTDAVIERNTPCKIVIARTVDNTSEVADIDTFVNTITISTIQDEVEMFRQTLSSFGWRDNIGIKDSTGDYFINNNVIANTNFLSISDYAIDGKLMFLNKLRLNYERTFAIAFYGNDYSFIERIGYTTNIVFTIPNNAVYFKISLGLKISNVQQQGISANFGLQDVYILQNRTIAENVGLNAKNSLNSSVYPFTYYGERINLKKCRFNWGLFMEEERIPDDINIQLQGCDCYNDYLFQCIDSNAKIGVFDLKTRTLIEKVSMIDTNANYHCNCVSFGTEKYDNADEYPLLYISMQDPNSSVTTVHKCLVFRVQYIGGHFTFTLVQTITYPEWAEGFYYANAVVDKENKKMILLSLTNYPYIGDYGNTLKYYVFDLPKLSDGNVTLQIADSLYNATIYDIPANQDAKVYNNKLYLSTATNYGKIYVVDLSTNKVVSIVDLYNNGISAEPEGLAIYDERILSIQSDRKVYELEF